MPERLLGGLLVGGMAIVLGSVGVMLAIRTRRNRASIAATYGEAGGIFYTVAQLGCGGALIVTGLAVIVLALVAGHH